ncbi:LytR/AlgR family response regulator transcription factor [Psychroserpens ponticola]|uniref:Response regulator n=1 Tax=Psychroserpens ponticola TaxID=2932268 RepID=A0ABY7RWT7_9FLAO|nr:response regulator [Psychroserpens ponticola]WCO01399.1 response regulator [Psychroserpens ponticola]
MKSIYIVEDEPIIARTIKTALEQEGYTICGMANNGKEALYDIDELQPDLVLLDITLKGTVDGITVAEKLQKTSNIPYVFLTSLTDSETTERVKLTKPAGFISKPFTIASLRNNIEIALFKLNEDATIETETTVDDEALFIKNKSEFIKLSKADILFFEASDFYCYAHTLDRKILISRTLKYVETNINDSTFIRVHRSYIINIKKIDALYDGYLTINKKTIPVSKSNKDKLLNSLSLL